MIENKEHFPCLTSRSSTLGNRKLHLQVCSLGPCKAMTPLQGNSAFFSGTTNPCTNHSWGLVGSGRSMNPRSNQSCTTFLYASARSRCMQNALAVNGTAPSLSGMVAIPYVSRRGGLDTTPCGKQSPCNPPEFYPSTPPLGKQHLETHSPQRGGYSDKGHNF